MGISRRTHHTSLDVQILRMLTKIQFDNNSRRNIDLGREKMRRNNAVSGTLELKRLNVKPIVLSTGVSHRVD